MDKEADDELSVQNICWLLCAICIGWVVSSTNVALGCP